MARLFILSLYAFIQARSIFEVAQLKSFTKASHALYISQPAISKHIQQLEEEYGVPLFERKGSGIFLTPSGEVLLTATMKAKAIGQKVKFDLSTFHDQYAAKVNLDWAPARRWHCISFRPSCLDFIKSIHMFVRVSSTEILKMS